MKVEYKNITGALTKNSSRCAHCCFYHLKNCIPIDIYECHSVFEQSKTQIFDL